MASEDSDQVVPGFLAVHGLSDFDDLDQPCRLQMPAGGDELQTAGECFEVVPLRSEERMLAEEWNNHLHKIRSTLDAVLQEILAMIVVPGISGDPSHSEEPLEVLQAGGARSTLRDSKAMGHLIAGSVAASAF